MPQYADIRYTRFVVSTGLVEQGEYDTLQFAEQKVASLLMSGKYDNADIARVDYFCDGDEERKFVAEYWLDDSGHVEKSK